MDIAVLQRKLGIDNTKVARKAAELLRLSQVKLGPGSLGQAEVCRTAACLELACFVCGAPFDRSMAMRLSCSPDKQYTRALTCLRNTLNLKCQVNLRDLAVTFGCLSLVNNTQALLDRFKERFVAELPPQRRATADFSRPVFTAVALFLHARKSKLLMDKRKLLQATAVEEDDFGQMEKQFERLCADLLGSSVKAPRPKASSVPASSKLQGGQSGAGGADEEDGSDSEGSSIDEEVDEEIAGEVPGLRQSKAAAAKRSYEQWKERVQQTRN
eukprot:jgi/Mesvir1/5496/Mv15541-RA.1